ncbi:hypothetical protein D918_04966 [Trichuris suis]|nr:hypothetical protein D918_04966 [Trichuris suis]
MREKFSHDEVGGVRILWSEAVQQSTCDWMKGTDSLSETLTFLFTLAWTGAQRVPLILLIAQAFFDVRVHFNDEDDDSDDY